MKIIPRIYFILLASIALFPFAAIAASSTQLSAGMDYLFLKHENYDENSFVLNTESGWIPGVQLTMSTMSSRWQGQATLEAYKGEISYQEQMSDKVSNSVVQQDLTRLSYRLEKFNSQKAYRFYGLILFQSWDRNSQSNADIIGRNNKYRWVTLEGGFHYDLYKTKHHELNIEFGASRTLFSKALMDKTNEGLGKPLVSLNDKFGFSQKFSYRYILNRKSGIELLMQTRYWQFSSSDVKRVTIGNTTTDVSEPESQSLSFSLGATYFYQF